MQSEESKDPQEEPHSSMSPLKKHTLPARLRDFSGVKYSLHIFLLCLFVFKVFVFFFNEDVITLGRPNISTFFFY